MHPRTRVEETSVSVSGSSKAVFIAVLAVVVVGGLLAFQYQGRQSASADAAQQNGGPGQWQGGGNFQGGPGGGFPGGVNRPPLVGAGKVTRGAIRQQLALVGSLKPKEQVQVVPRITGKVEQVLVNVGDQVRQGQLLATLEGEELDQQVLRAEASLAVAQATLSQRQAEMENARADEERTAQLAAEGLVSEQQRQTAETRGRVVDAQQRLAEAQVRAAQADLAELKIRQQQLQVVSPLSGWVGQRFIDPGALVSANTPIVSVLGLSSLITEVRVPEEQLASLRPGSRALVAIDALGGQTFEGRVARISPVLDAATRSGLLQVEIPNADGQLKAEMSARILLDVGAEREAVLVPGDAVVVRGLQTGVHVLEGDRVRFQPVKTGITTDQGVEILEGIAVGTPIVIKGSQTLQDGSVVEVSGGPGVGALKRSGS
jgi:RND family efflux transporter MFP subunit